MLILLAFLAPLLASRKGSHFSFHTCFCAQCYISDFLVGFFCLVHFFLNQGAGTDSAWETAFILYVFWNCINYSSCKELIEAFCFIAGESIPIRLFLAGYDPTPTMRDVNKKFSVRYFLNLVLVDEEDRRYFKQQVWSIAVLLQNCMLLWTFSRCFLCGASISACKCVDSSVADVTLQKRNHRGCWMLFQQRDGAQYHRICIGSTQTKHSNELLVHLFVSLNSCREISPLGLAQVQNCKALTGTKVFDWKC